MFFASFCTPCHKELPRVAAAVPTFPRRVSFVGIDATDDRSAGRNFVTTSGVRFPVGFDPNGDVTQGIFGFAQLPETVFIDSHGVVQQVYFGAIPVHLLRAAVADLH
jgi:thiol-disulfide isomerase/thioredoxin